MLLSISNEELQSLNESENTVFPKYTSQLINWANQNAQGTRPRIVGQLSEVFPEFLSDIDSISIVKWKSWYMKHFPQAIDKATDRIFEQVKNLKNAIQLIDKEMVRHWVEDLVVTKTYNGMYVQKAILAKLADSMKLKYRLATPKEESVGIDGYVGDTAYSIKPDTYKTMNRLPEQINVKMIYYTKTKTCLKFEVDD